MANNTLEDGMDTRPTWARFSDCGRYRYTLGRRWAEGPLMGYVGMNPSVAAADREDATSRRFRSFAQREGCGAYEAVNLDAMVATDHGELRRAARSGHDVTGPGNDDVILDLARRAHPVVVCWGTGGAHRTERATRVLAMLQGAGVTAWCLGLTNGGHPRHPLFVRSAKLLEAFEL